MTLSTDITLPANIQPVFPCRCVVCGEESSDTAKISADAQGFIVSFFVPLMSLLGRKKIEFPICPECKPRFFRQRWIRSLICWSIIIVVVFVALPYFQGWNRSVTKLAVLGIGIAAVVPQLIFEVFFPRWFDITASKETVDYEFKSEDYATDFYVLNREAFPDVEILVDNELVNNADEIAD